MIVPGFGGFVANYRSARIHPALHTFTPPSKKIAFNRNLKNNDGLLANRLAVSERLTYDEATRYISECVLAWNRLLEKEKRLSLEKIGVLFFDPEKKLCFEPSNAVNYLPESFGLSEVQFSPVRREGASWQPEKVVHPPRAFKVRKRTFPWRAAAILLIGLGVAELAWLSYHTGFLKDHQLNYSLINPFSDSVSKRETEKRTAAPVLPEARWESPAGKAPEDSEITVESIPPSVDEISPPVSEPAVEPVEETAAPPAPAASSSGQEYLVIAGCFKIPENAENLLKKLQSKGYPASIAGKNRRGLIMVSYRSFSNAEEARALLQNVKATEDSSSWLLIR